MMPKRIDSHMPLALLTAIVGLNLILLSCGRAPESIIDHHVHLLTPQLIEDWKSLGVPFSRSDHAYSNLDSILRYSPADRISVISMAYLYGTDDFSDDNEYENVKRENTYVAHEGKRLGGRVRTFCSVDGRKEYAVDEILRCRKTLKMDGIKLHFNACSISLRSTSHLTRIREIFRLAAHERMPLLLHFENGSGRFGQLDIDVLIDSVLTGVSPMVLILAHMGTSGGFTPMTERIVRSLSSAARPRDHSVYFDISAVVLSDTTEGVLPTSSEEAARAASLMREIGISSFLFGTDYPLINSRKYRADLQRMLALTEDELTTLLSNDIKWN
jgi:predicted TIM-barrel fold metal-dependent hydrolase